MIAKVGFFVLLTTLLASCSVIRKNGYYQSRKYQPNLVKLKKPKAKVAKANAFEYKALSELNVSDDKSSDNLFKSCEIDSVSKESNHFVQPNYVEQSSDKKRVLAQYVTKPKLALSSKNAVRLKLQKPTQINEDKPKLVDTFWYGFGLILLGVAFFGLASTGLPGIYGLFASFLGLALFIYGVAELISYLVRLTRKNKEGKEKLDEKVQNDKTKKITIWNAKFIAGIVFLAIGLLFAICALSVLASTTTASLLLLFEFFILLGCIAGAIFFLTAGIAMISLGISHYSEKVLSGKKE